uniref:Fibrinogen C-terminal domain-containing protein n=1 Tax=Anopheles dirus TaxID=7168 RepID=A0A182MY95_9DIPT
MNEQMAQNVILYQERLDLLSQKVDSGLLNHVGNITKSIDTLEKQMKELELTNQKILEIVLVNITQLSAQVVAEAVTSTSKLEDQLKEIRNENSAMIETVKGSISTLDEKMEELDISNTNAFTSLRGYIGLLSSELSSSLEDLSDSGKGLSTHLEQRMEQLTSYTGVYSWSYPGHGYGFHVYREGLQSHGYGGDWIVFQRRFDGSVEFNRSWTDYKHGFGDPHGEHWLGLNKLHSILLTGRHELLIELETFYREVMYAKYDDFQLGGDSEGYKLKSLGGCTGTVKDSLTKHIGKVFVTYDKNDANNCARSYGGGWWFDKCYHAHLNGRYHGRHHQHKKGVSWNAFHQEYTMKMHSVSTMRILVTCGLFVAVQFRPVAAEVSGFGFEMLLVRLEAFESRINEQLVLLSQKVDSVILNNNNMKVFENTNTNAFTSLRSNISSLSNGLSTSVDHLSDSGKKLFKRLEDVLEKQMKELRTVNNKIFEIIPTNITQLSAQVKVEAMSSTSKLQDQLKEIRKENSANFERVAKTVGSTLDEKLKVFENTNTKAFTNLRSYFTLLSSRLNTSVGHLTDSGKMLFKNLEDVLKKKMKELEITNNNIFEIIPTNITQLSAQVKAETATSTSKLEDQLKEIRKENSANFDRVAKTVSTLDEKLKVFENTNTNAFTNLRNYVSQLSSKLGTTLEDLSDSGKELSTHLEHRMEQLTSYTGVYSWMQPSHDFGFHVYREGLQSHGYGGDWIVFQRRFDGSVEFNRSWTDYEHGFGDPRGEHWLGLKKLRNILSTGRHELLVELETFYREVMYAKYDDFQLGKESEGYKLKSLGCYTGNAEDSLRNHIGMLFVTFDKNDVNNCVRLYGGGWWFHKCYSAHLNGRYYQRYHHKNKGVSWNLYEMDYSMKSTKMMMLMVRLEALESLFNERLELLDQKVDSIISNNNKLNQRLWELELETSDNFEKVIKRIKKLEQTHQKSFGDLRSYVTQHSDGVATAVDYLTQAGVNETKLLTQQRMEELTAIAGVYTTKYDSSKYAFRVYRDGLQNHGYGGNWTVFQRRIDGSVAFNRSILEYQFGFGDLSGEHWLGLDKLYAVLSTGRHELLIELEDFDGNIGYANYDDFQIGNFTESYKIKSIGSYSGTAGDALKYHEGKKFSTFDYNDGNNCARDSGGGGWFDNMFCYYMHLNGQYRQKNDRLMDAFESRMLDSLNKLEEQLQEFKKETSANFEIETKASSRIEKQFEEFEKTHKKSFEDLRAYVTQRSDGVATAVEYLSQASVNQTKLLTQQRMEELTAVAGVYIANYNTWYYAFRVYRDGFQNHRYGGNWTVFQRRIDGSVNFNRSWSDYRNGFGDLHGEHWLGLEKLNAVLITGRHELLIELEDFDGYIVYAKYDDFQIGDVDESYKIESIGSYSGTAGDALRYHVGKKFSTFDYNDGYNCALNSGGGGWFNSMFCYRMHLNGHYRQRGYESDYMDGIFWESFTEYSLKATKMMIRQYSS